MKVDELLDAIDNSLKQVEGNTNAIFNLGTIDHITTLLEELGTYGLTYQDTKNGCRPHL